MELPINLDKCMHPRADRALAGRILEYIDSVPWAVCISDVRTKVGCANMTATKHLNWMKKAGLVTERRIGRARVFYKTEAWDGANRGGGQIDRP
jgi:hypothetical protein